MKISARVDYACRALVELSLHWPSKKPLQINRIAKRQEIPINFLTHILINLKQLGYVNSIRGKSGGYILAKDPKNFSLKEVISDMGGSGFALDSHNDLKKNIMNGFWEEIDEVLLSTMATITFEIIAQRARQQDEAIMFDI